MLLLLLLLLLLPLCPSRRCLILGLGSIGGYMTSSSGAAGNVHALS
jgi:hypothetical protein